MPFRIQFFPAALAVFVALTVPQHAMAAEPDVDAKKARLDQVAGSYTPEQGFMGTALVADGDTILLDKGYGKADVEWDIANIPAAKFRIGSLTKQFTAALVLLLQQDGKLNIADPISRYLPDAPKAWSAITLAELLGHTSGIPEFTDDPHFSEWSMSPHTPAEELAFFRDKPLDFAPGSKFAYSNSNYEVLGVVIEKVSGKSYRDVLGERILKPLGMNDTGVDDDALILAKRAQGYKLKKGELEIARSESMTVPYAAGALYSTTGDLLRWEHGLFGGKLLSARSLKLMTTPGKGDYGLGVLAGTRNGVQFVWHNGGIEGFGTYLAYVPARRIAVVVFSNIEGSIPTIMGDQLLDVALGNPVVLASEHKAVPIAAEELAKFEGTFLLTPTQPFTFVRNGDALSMKSTTTAYPMIYEGIRDGHPTFYVAARYLEIEFIPDSKGAMASIVLHQGAMNATAARK